MRLYKLIEIKTADEHLGTWSEVEKLFPHITYEGDLVRIDAQDILDAEANPTTEAQKDIIAEVRRDMRDEDFVEYYTY